MVVNVLPQYLEYYTTFLDAEFAPESQIAALSDDLNRLLIVDLNEKSVIRKFSLPSFLVSLKTINDRLVGCRADSGLSVFSWQNLLKKGSEGGAPTDESNSTFFAREVSGSAVNYVNRLGDSTILLGCRNGAVQVVSMDNGGLNVISDSKAHKHQITALSVQSEHCFVSASSNGIVNTWDIREGLSKTVRKIKVGDEKRVQRKELGNSLFVMDANADFMVCGGGLQMGVWHLPSGSLVDVISDESALFTEWHALELNKLENTFMCGGLGPNLSLYNLSCQSQLSLPLRLGAINVIKQRHIEMNSVTLIGGESSDLQLVMNQGYNSATIKTRP